MLQNIFLVFYFFDKSRPASERHLQETEGRGKGQTKRNTVCAYPSSNLWTGQLRGRSKDYPFVALLLDAAVNAPIGAVALRVSDVVKLFQRYGILFLTAPAAQRIPWFIRERSHPLRSRLYRGLSVPKRSEHPLWRSLAVYGVAIVGLHYPSGTPPSYLP